MKRTTLILIPILLAAMLLCSCNADAQDGIYSAIADSTLDSGTKVKAYLGRIGAYDYVLTDSAVIRLGSGSDTFTQIQSTKDALLDEAALVADGSEGAIYIHANKSGTNDPSSDSRILKYTLAGDYVGIVDTDVIWLTTNGAYYTEKESEYIISFIFTDHISHLSSLEKKISSAFESENYLLVQFEDGKITIYRNGYDLDPLRMEWNHRGRICGFQVISDTEFLVIVKNDSSYDVYYLCATNDGTHRQLEDKEKVESLKSSSSSDGIQSFHYANDGKDYAVFKMDNYFDQLEITTDSSSGEKKYAVTTLNTAGYASKLRTSLIVSTLPYDGDIIIATFSNSIWKIDPTNRIEPEEIK